MDTNDVGSIRNCSFRSIQATFCLPHRIKIPDGSATPFGIFSLYGAGRKIPHPSIRRRGGYRPPSALFVYIPCGIATIQDHKLYDLMRGLLDAEQLKENMKEAALWVV